ncbi:MAG: AAA family ATPase [Chloroflexi bacterium]|nr:AAA family ATPase [Chloroflexota bacterium]
MTNENFLWSDKPLKNPESDEFGYANFAEMLAQSIHKMSSPDGLVMAIYGAWGTGKTTTVEFVLHYLEQLDSENVIIVRFNPWWFAGSQHLLGSFFEQLQAVLRTRLEERFKPITDSLKTIGDTFSKVPIKELELLGSAAQGIYRLYTTEDIFALKERLNQRLAESGKKIIIVIDDIDRLASDEIKQLFTVIKAVADFSNTIYLLAFDQDIVSEALDSSGKWGDNYLEKIVQVSFELPSPDILTLRQFLLGKLAALLGEIPKDLVRYSPVRTIFQRDSNYVSDRITLIQEYLSTPRDVFRFLNTIKVTYPVVEDEVNKSDFISIEALRVFERDIYNVIRQNKSIFTGKEASEYDKKFLETLLNETAKDIEVARKIVYAMFPKFDFGAWVTHMRSIEREYLNIYSPSNFDVYFQLSVPSEQISNVELDAIVAAANSQTEIDNQLLEYAMNKIRFDNFLQQFKYKLKDLTPDGKMFFLNSLFKISDDIIFREEIHGFEWDVTLERATSLVYTILGQYSPEVRYQKLEEAIVSTDKTLMPLSVLFHIEIEPGGLFATMPQGIDPSRISFFRADEYPLLRKLAITLLKEVDRSGYFYELPVLYTSRFLQLWLSSDPEGCREAINSKTHSQPVLLKLGHMHIDARRNRANEKYIYSFSESMGQIIDIDFYCKQFAKYRPSFTLNEQEEIIANYIQLAIENHLRQQDTVD